MIYSPNICLASSPLIITAMIIPTDVSLSCEQTSLSTVLIRVYAGSVVLNRSEYDMNEYELN